MEIALISDHVRTILQSYQNGLALTFDMEGTNPLSMIEWQQPLYQIKWEHIPQSHQNGPTLISDHVKLHLIVISEWPLVLD